MMSEYKSRQWQFFPTQNNKRENKQVKKWVYYGGWQSTPAKLQLNIEQYSRNFPIYQQELMFGKLYGRDFQ